MVKLKNIIILISISIIFISQSVGQVLDGIYEKEHVPARKPIPYVHLREADIMWSKKIWRILDLHEKMNHPLYFPTNPIGKRMSLIDLLIWGKTKENLRSYTATDAGGNLTDRFEFEQSPDDFKKAMGAGRDSVAKKDSLDNITWQYFNKSIDDQKSTIYKYLIKEEWFFDRQRSVMEVRIIGICPIRDYIDPVKGPISQFVGFFYFPELRGKESAPGILPKFEVFNRNNDAERKSYDDIFFKRYFSSYIMKESNVYDDREISSYTMGLASMLEAEKIKEWIFNFEQDLWEY